jgi:hypothetical protein
MSKLVWGAFWIVVAFYLFSLGTAYHKAYQAYFAATNAYYDVKNSQAKEMLFGK